MSAPARARGHVKGEDMWLGQHGRGRATCSCAGVRTCMFSAALAMLVCGCVSFLNLVRVCVRRGARVSRLAREWGAWQSTDRDTETHLCRMQGGMERGSRV